MHQTPGPWGVLGPALPRASPREGPFACASTGSHQRRCPNPEMPDRPPRCWWWVADRWGCWWGGPGDLQRSCPTWAILWSILSPLRGRRLKSSSSPCTLRTVLPLSPASPREQHPGGCGEGFFFSPDPSSPVPSVGHRETIVRPRRVTLNAEVILPLRANPELLPSHWVPPDDTR